MNIHPIICEKVCHFIEFYWSPKQSHDEFNSFIKNLELNLDEATNSKSRPAVVLVIF